MSKETPENLPATIRLADWLTVEQAAEILGVNRGWVYKLGKAGCLKTIQVFGRMVFSRKDVMDWLEHHSRRGQREKLQ